jgi:hypothetical protein
LFESCRESREIVRDRIEEEEEEEEKEEKEPL